MPSSLQRISIYGIYEMQWNLAVNKTGDAGDRSTMYYDNFREKFVFSI